MGQVIYPPAPLVWPDNAYTIFLAGSIEMGAAIDWQSMVCEAFATSEAVLLNPRREAWDSSWVQAADNPQFRAQVEWELAAQEQADLIAMYFDPQTKAPITLLELGLFAHHGKLMVCCPSGYWRKGNVDVVCQRYSIPQVESLAALIEAAQQAYTRRVGA